MKTKNEKRAWSILQIAKRYTSPVDGTVFQNARMEIEQTLNAITDNELREKTRRSVENQMGLPRYRRLSELAIGDFVMSFSDKPEPLKVTKIKKMQGQHTLMIEVYVEEDDSIFSDHSLLVRAEHDREIRLAPM